MKRAVWIGAGLVVALVSFASIFAATYVPTIEQRTMAGPVPVGGLTKEAAARKLRIWWETERLNELKVSLANGVALEPKTPGKLGVTLDDVATLAEAPMTEAMDVASKAVGQGEPQNAQLKLVFRATTANLNPILDEAKKTMGPPKPARAFWAEGAIQRVPEVATYQVIKDQIAEATIQALLEGKDEVVLPVEEAPKRVSDEELAKLVDVVGSFYTSFSAGNRPRASNIRVASEYFNGQVLLPGDRISFNQTVGKRTPAKGFKLAGVYVNGRHDTGIGGGICQVSTTLYNASLLSNLKIVQRTNHSLPVPYVPTGQDATVSFPNLDLIIENSYETPIAIQAEYKPGRLMVRIIGQRDPSLKVRISREVLKSWDNGVKTVVDPTLAYGKTKVVDKGARGLSVRTFRVVYRDGVLTEKQPLGRSIYSGAPKLIAVPPTPGGEVMGGQSR
ncbi:MAG: VanW family protein [Fimbriimonas sp.]